MKKPKRIQLYEASENIAIILILLRFYWDLYWSKRTLDMNIVRFSLILLKDVFILKIVQTLSYNLKYSQEAIIYYYFNHLLFAMQITSSIIDYYSNYIYIVLLFLYHNVICRSITASIAQNYSEFLNWIFYPLLLAKFYKSS